MKVVCWTDSAVADLERIQSYIAADSNAYAQALMLEILTAVDRLESFPESGRIVPEINHTKVRELIVGNYRIIYELKSRKIYILTVVHGARLLARHKIKKAK